MERYCKFWGTRGSCPVSGADHTRYGGNTCCLEVCYDADRFIIDAGTGIRPLGDVWGQNEVNLFFGHLHWDHVIGLPFFAPIHRQDTHLTIWSPEKSSKGTLRSLFSSKFFPVSFDVVSARTTFRTAHRQEPIALGALSVECHPANHPGGAFAFKIRTPRQTIGYVTDNEVFEGNHATEVSTERLQAYQSLITFLSDCDLLIHEAQYSTEEYVSKVGWGHSSLRNAATLIRMTHAKEWWVTHHDPRHTDHDLDRLANEATQLVSARVHWVVDGEVLPLP